MVPVDTAQGEPAGTPTRPMLTITEAARAARKDRRTVRRWLEEGRLDGAHQINGRWVIPVEGLIAAGVPLHQSRPPAGPPGTHRTADGVVDTLREELAVARAQAKEAEARARIAEALAEERRHALDDLRLALRALAPGTLDGPLPGMPDDNGSAPPVARRRWWRRATTTAG